jgi:23S rRNA pseudouridine2605 synthase
MPPPPKSEDTVRLHVLLARCGFGSRRACEEFVKAGRVSVNGTVVTTPGYTVTRKVDKVLVDDESVRPVRPAYYMVNKPKGMLCTTNDPAGRPRVVDLFPKSAGRVFPIGRLDENTVGLILVTNDGEMSHQLAHPRFRVAKVYHVLVAGLPTPEILKQLREGMYFSDGRFKVEKARKIGRRGKSTVLEVVLKEGQNREIRRLFARVGHKVMKLERVAFGPLQLRGVAVGRARPLTREEVKLLQNHVEQREHRQREDGQRASQKKNSTKRSAKQRPPKSSRPGTVEVSPLEVTAARDLTGRRREPVKREPVKREPVKREPVKREAATEAPHPAIAKPRKSRKS